jgi:hypothetical protein
MRVVSAWRAARTGSEAAHRVPTSVVATNMTVRRFFIEISPWSRGPGLQNFVLRNEASPLLCTEGRAIGVGADPSPITMTGVVALTEVAPLTALRAPASIKAARVAIIVFFIFTTSDYVCLTIRIPMWV